jgi:hypothetical protein
LTNSGNNRWAFAFGRQLSALSCQPAEGAALSFALAHLMDEAELVRAFERVRNDAAVGVDGVTKEAYKQNLDANIQDLLTRMKAKRPTRALTRA